VYIFGWNNAQEVAETVWTSIHHSLLQGELVFAYRGSGDLKQIIVVKLGSGQYGVGMITTGFTMLVPKIPADSIEEFVTADLKKYKLDVEIIKGLKNNIIK
jgi:hypothetical protein